MHNGVPVRYGKPTRRRGSNLLIIIIIVIILALLAGGYFTYNKFFGGKNSDADKPAEDVNPPFELIIIEDEEAVREEVEETEDENTVENTEELTEEQVITEEETVVPENAEQQIAEEQAGVTPTEPLPNENPETLVP